jgi:predicted metal-dependent hydrolase
VSTISVRKPNFDFSDVPAVWGSDLWIVHMVNAQGIVPAYIEPYLIKVLRLAKAKLDAEQNRALLEDIDAFIAQEAQHYKFHRSLNEVVRDAGYDRMKEFERAYAADYEEFLERPLEWQLAYCDGFEAMGSAGAAFAVDGGYELMLGGDADPRPIELWRWHLAEEYEHRSVVFETYKALYGHRPLRAWIVRVRGFLFCARHLFGHIRALSRYLVETDLARMMPNERAAARKRRRRLGSRPFAIQPALRLLRVLSPFYDPASIPPPGQYRTVLARYE